MSLPEKYLDRGMLSFRKTLCAIFTVHERTEDLQITTAEILRKTIKKLLRSFQILMKSKKLSFLKILTFLVFYQFNYLNQINLTILSVLKNIFESVMRKATCF